MRPLAACSTPRPPPPRSKTRGAFLACPHPPSRVASSRGFFAPSCLEKLAHLEITYPMIFEITNPRYLQRRLHCARAHTGAP